MASSGLEAAKLRTERLSELRLLDQRVGPESSAHNRPTSGCLAATLSDCSAPADNLGMVFRIALEYLVLKAGARGSTP